MAESGDQDLRLTVRAAAHELNNTLSVLRLTLDLAEREQLDWAAASAQLREHVAEASRLVESLQQAAHKDG